MVAPAAFHATFSDFKLIKSRKQAQIVLEVPLEQADAALRILGGVPRPDQDRWVAVAMLNMKAVERPKRSWNELPLSQQAALACNDERFRNWIIAGDADQAAVKVRRECLVNSRSELDTDKDAAGRWHQLYQSYREETGLETEAR